MNKVNDWLNDSEVKQHLGKPIKEVPPYKIIDVDRNFINVEDFMPGPGCDLELLYSELDLFCECTTCRPDSCPCMNRLGANYVNGTIAEEKLKPGTKCILECSHSCSCNLSCPNRVIQKGPNPNTEVRYAGGKGLGLFATQNIPKGTFVCEYVGEVISKEESTDRLKIGEHHKYILILRECCAGNVVETFIDATNVANIGRYINHSCEPNSAIVVARIGSPFARPCIFTIKDILDGEEITYSYGTDLLLSATPCLCQSPGCWGFLPADDSCN